MLITRSRLSSTRDIPLFISFREAMADVQRFDLLDPAEVARLEDPRTGRPPVREAVRARDQPARDDSGGREPLDGLARLAQPAHQAGLCRPAGGGARADPATPAGRHWADHLR